MKNNKNTKKVNKRLKGLYIFSWAYTIVAAIGIIFGLIEGDIWITFTWLLFLILLDIRISVKTLVALKVYDLQELGK